MNFSWHHVITGDGIGITVTGMLIVFSGLALISLFIKVLPLILERKSTETMATAKLAEQALAVDAEPTDEELLAIISVVLHEEIERSLGDSGRLTIARQQKHASIWASAGKMRSLSEGGLNAPL